MFIYLQCCISPRTRTPASHPDPPHPPQYDEQGVNEQLCLKVFVLECLSEREELLACTPRQVLEVAFPFVNFSFPPPPLTHARAMHVLPTHSTLCHRKTRRQSLHATTCCSATLRSSRRSRPRRRPPRRARPVRCPGTASPRCSCLPTTTTWTPAPLRESGPTAASPWRPGSSRSASVRLPLRWASASRRYAPPPVPPARSRTHTSHPQLSWLYTEGYSADLIWDTTMASTPDDSLELRDSVQKALKQNLAAEEQQALKQKLSQVCR